MKPGKTIFATIISVALLAIGATAVLAASVSPVLVDPWQSGNAAFECAQINGYDYGYKIDSWNNSISGPFVALFGDGHTNTITISNNNGTSFDWSATNSIGAVIVKGGPAANVFSYIPQVFSDTNLYAPTNPNNNQPYGISHVTFCWDPDEEECEWVGETAWAFGPRYVERGNWATYTPYVANSTVTLYAGQNMPAGTVHFSAVSGGMVTITITLNEGWRLEDVMDPVKVQGYASTPPAKNPAPGLFTTYKGSLLVFNVPAYDFYGVHLNVEWEDCPEPEV